MHLELLDLPARTFQAQLPLYVRMGTWPSSRQFRSDAPWSFLHEVKSGPSMGFWLYLPRALHSRSEPSLTVQSIFLCSLAMRSSSWPGPSGRVRKRSRSGWQGFGDRNRRTWSWLSPSARLICRPRCHRGSCSCLYVHTRAQSVPHFKPCHATAKDSWPWALRLQGPC